MDIKPILLSLKHNKFMAILMVIQIALTMGVLSSSVLVATATLSEWNMPSGIPHEDIVRISPEFYDETQDVGQAMVRDIERVEQMSQVVAITTSSQVPFTSERLTNVYVSADKEAKRHQTAIFDSDKALFNVLDLKLVEGRWLDDSDLVKGPAETTPESASVVMVSQDMATELFGENSAVGETVWLSQGGNPVQIVGVYSNFMTGERLNGQGRSYQSMIRPQIKWAANSQPHYLMRVAGGQAATLMPDLLALFYKERGRYVNTTELLKRTQKRMYDGRGSRALTFLVISAVLLLITALGITGLTAFQITQKKKQIGTRRALGAKKRDIIRYFLTENAIITWLGLTLGIIVTLIISFDLSQSMNENLLSFSVLGATGLLIWFINALAVWFPARQAANIAPAIVTRSA